MNQVADARDLVTLGDPTRARILRLIRDSDDGRALVGRLADALELRQPTVSHHMKALHDRQAHRPVRLRSTTQDDHRWPPAISACSAATTSGIDAVRPIRDEIRRRIESLLADLLPEKV